jgi:hypothetical protein
MQEGDYKGVEQADFSIFGYRGHRQIVFAQLVARQRNLVARMYV